MVIKSSVAHRVGSLLGHRQDSVDHPLSHTASSPEVFGLFKVLAAAHASPSADSDHHVDPLDTTFDDSQVELSDDHDELNGPSARLAAISLNNLPSSSLSNGGMLASPSDMSESSSFIQSDSASVAVVPSQEDEASAAEKLAAISADFGDIAGLMENADGVSEPESLLATSKGSLFK